MQTSFYLKRNTNTNTIQPKYNQYSLHFHLQALIITVIKHENRISKLRWEHTEYHTDDGIIRSREQ